MSSGITRVARPVEFTNSGSTARAALTAEPPVPHGDPDGVGDVRIAREAPMQDLPKHIAYGIHVASARLEHSGGAPTSSLIWEMHCVVAVVLCCFSSKPKSAGLSVEAAKL